MRAARLLVVSGHATVWHKAVLNRPGREPDALQVWQSALPGLTHISRSLCKHGVGIASGTQANTWITLNCAVWECLFIWR